MKALRRVQGRVAPLLRTNVDTDQIIPASFLKVTGRDGLGQGLFAHWRYDADGDPRPEFVLNRPENAGAPILLAGDNFGCGSSREHAVWALLEGGFRVVVSTRFADIFRTNSGRNGLLTAAVDAADHERLREWVTLHPDERIEVDLERQQISWPGAEIPFEIDPFARHCLLNGLDPLGYLLERIPAIEAFEARREAAE